jgi:signal transduction histidine kinase
MQNLNKLLQRQAQKYLGGLDKVPENYHAFIQAINESYNHYEKDHHLLERSIELSSTEMIELNEQLRKETEELKKAHDELRATEKIRLEKRLDEEKIKKLQEITEAVIAVQERERSYLGAELHDNINQVLATSMLYIDTAIHNESMRLNLITDSKKFIDSAMQEIRYLSKSLLPPSLSQASLVSALDDMIHNIKQVDRLQIITDWGNIDETQFSEKLKLTIFRIIQEQLNNIFKHAYAKTVIIELTQHNEALQLSIKDDGVGFDTLQKKKGVGLQNIVSRTNLFNGEVVVNSKPGAGCELLISFYKQVETIQQKIAS